jgi:hypothetical protein
VDLPLSARLAASEAPDTASFRATTTVTVISVSMAVTEPPDVAALAGRVLVDGWLEATEAPDTASLRANPIVGAALAASEAPDTAVMRANITLAIIRITMAATEAPDTAFMMPDTKEQPGPMRFGRKQRTLLGPWQVPVRW